MPVVQFCKAEFSEEEGSLGLDGDSQIDFFIFHLIASLDFPQSCSKDSIERSIIKCS